jgi:hypothetical protein
MFQKYCVLRPCEGNVLGNLRVSMQKLKTWRTVLNLQGIANLLSVLAFLV